MGSQGFFGRFDQDATGDTFGAFSQNAWLGAAARDILVSGSDAAWNTMFMNLDMELRINPAIRVRGRYYIGWWDPYLPATPTSNGIVPTGITYPTATGIRDRDVRPYLVNSEYVNSSAPGIRRSFSPGYWNMLWLTATTPWGVVAVGKRPFTWGMGLAWDGEDNRSTETLRLAADYGPLRFAVSFYPARQGFESYFNDYSDKNGLRVFDVSPLEVSYRNGPLDMGFQMAFIRRHQGAERIGTSAPDFGLGATTLKAIAGSREREDFYGGVYLKYNNGTFFWNSEFDWYDRRETNRTTSSFIKNYIQEYRIAAETGCLTGPAKISLLYAWLSGPDRRFGTTDNINQGVYTSPFPTSDAANIFSPLSQTQNQGLPLSPRWQSSELGNQGMFRPYTYLMVYNYGLGAYINADTGYGYAQDASCWGARIDYAVAANLNVYASFFKANRVGNGYGWGFLVPAPGGFGSASTLPPGLVTQRFKQGNFPPFNGFFAPNIPDDDLGYEFGAGFDWKLLEGLKVSLTTAWWQPGNWFKFACVDKATSPAWAGALNGSYNPLTAINPDRAIDPILGIELKTIGEF